MTLWKQALLIGLHKVGPVDDELVATVPEEPTYYLLSKTITDFLLSRNTWYPLWLECSPFSTFKIQLIIETLINSLLFHEAVAV